ncbi:carboxypeptidase regulatory-like domain-containing protein [Calditrichota bacterium]
MKYVCTCILAMLTLANPLNAETEVSGTINGGTWTEEGSPYILTGDITIPINRTLVIEPDVRVEGGSGLEIYVLGGIEAEGTEDEPIIFTTHDEDYFWDGINISHGTEDSYFEYCIFEYCDTFHGRGNGAAFNIQYSTAEFQHCEFRNNHSSTHSNAFYAYASDIVMQYCWIHDNYASSFGGTDLISCNNAVFSYNLITNNRSSTGAAMSHYSGYVHVDHCTFYGNSAQQNGTNFYGNANRDFTNCIIIADTVYQLATSASNAEYGCFSHQSNVWGDDCFVDDPLFVDADNDDYHLQINSPCIDAGDPDYDRDVDGSVTDIGCFPFVGGGYLSGIVILSEDGDPLDSVYVAIYSEDELINYTYTNLDGEYDFQRLEDGEYSVYFNRPCFSDTTYTDVTIEIMDSVTVNHLMTLPSFAFDPLTIEVDLVPDQTINYPSALTNRGNGHLDYSTEIYLQDPRENPDAVSEGWSLIHTSRLDSNESRNRGIVFVDGYIYVSGSDNFDPIGPNKIYQYSANGDTLLATFDQPVPPENRGSAGFYDLAWDGEYFYGVDFDIIYQMEINPADNDNEGSIELIVAWDLPIDNIPSFLAYDPDNDLFWMGDIPHSVLYAVDREGNIEHEFDHDMTIRGCAWNPDDEDGYNLYFIDRTVDIELTMIVKMNPENGDFMDVHSYDSPAGRMVVASADITSSWHPLFRTMLCVVDNGTEDYIEIRSFANNRTNFSISRPTGTVPGQSEIDVGFVFRRGDMIDGEYPFFIKFVNNACETDDNVVEVVINAEPYINTVQPGLEVQPLEWAFDGIYPNPFNPDVNVEFSLRHPVHVRAIISNLMGQEVAVLAENRLKAGFHRLTFNGENLASGIYLLRFEAGPLQEVRKIVLVR